MYNTNSKFPILANYINPDTPGLLGTPTHIDRFGYGGLKTFSSSSYVFSDPYIHNEFDTVSVGRAAIGQIVFLNSDKRYYQCYDDSGPYGLYKRLQALQTGSITLTGLTSSNGIVVSGGNINIMNGYLSVSSYVTATTFTSSVANGIPPLKITSKTQVDNLNSQYVGGVTISAGTINRIAYWGSNTSIVSSNKIYLDETIFSSSIPITASSGINITTGSLIINNQFQTGDIHVDIDGNLILNGNSKDGVQITDGILWIGPRSNNIGFTVNGPNIITGGRLVAERGFTNTENSFTVDNMGNLICYSLKETSLKQFKHDIYPISSSQLDNILKLNPITFLYKEDTPQDINDPHIRQAGFLAQEIEKIYPEVAWYQNGKLSGLQYQRLTAFLTKAIQQLIIQNRELMDRIEKLEGKQRKNND